MDSSASPTPSLARPSATLAVLGCLVIGTALVIANPTSSFFPQWPWELVASSPAPLVMKTTFVGWCLLGLWLLGSAFSSATRVRSFVAFVLASLVTLQMLGLGPREFRILRFHLGDLVCLVSIAGGLLLVLDERTRRAGRLLACAGAVAFLVLNLAAVEQVGDGFVARLAFFQEAIEAHLAGEDLGKRAHFEKVYSPFWLMLVPGALLLLAAVLAIPAALVGGRLRWAPWAVLALWLAGIAFPFFVRQHGALTLTEPTAAGVTLQAARSMTEDAVLLLPLLALTLAELCRSRAEGTA